MLGFPFAARYCNRKSKEAAIIDQREITFAGSD
jgi:hypothetical protein